MKTVMHGYDLSSSLHFVEIDGNSRKRFYEDGSTHELGEGCIWNRGFCDCKTEPGSELDYSSWSEDKRLLVESEWKEKRRIRKEQFDLEEKQRIEECERDAKRSEFIYNEALKSVSKEEIDWFVEYHFGRGNESVDWR